MQRRSQRRAPILETLGRRALCDATPVFATDADFAPADMDPADYSQDSPTLTDSDATPNTAPLMPLVPSSPMGGVLDDNPPPTDADALIVQLDILNGTPQAPPTAITPYDALD